MKDIDDEDCGKFLNALCTDFPYIPKSDTGDALAFYQHMMEKYPE